MPTYDYACKTCDIKDEVTCNISEMEDNIPECPEHGSMTRQITNNQKHTDDTPWRKGYYNSKESYWR